MKLRVVYGVVFTFAAASVYLIGIKPYPHTVTSPVVFNPTLPYGPIEIEEYQVKRATVFRDIYKGSNIIFSCEYIPHTDAGCMLYVSDASGGGKTSIKMWDYGLSPSPDGAHVAVVTPTEVFLFDSSTLASSSLLRAPTGEHFGFWSAFPTFQPRARWLDNTKVEFSLYKENTSHLYEQQQDGTIDVNDPSPLNTSIVDITK